MKKTIAKIMAAAMLLSSVAAPNVLAADSFRAAMGNGTAVQFTTLNLVQYSKNSTSVANFYHTDAELEQTSYSRTAPLDVAGSTTGRTDSWGHIASVKTDIMVEGNSRAINGNLAYIDDAAGTIGVVTANATTPVSVDSLTAVKDIKNEYGTTTEYQAYDPTGVAAGTFAVTYDATSKQYSGHPMACSRKISIMVRKSLTALRSIMMVMLSLM